MAPEAFDRLRGRSAPDLEATDVMDGTDSFTALRRSTTSESPHRDVARADAYVLGDEDGHDDRSGEAQVPVGTLFLSTVEDAMEAMQAAETLFLGVRVHNRLVPEDQPDCHFGQWVVEVFTDAQHVDE